MKFLGFFTGEEKKCELLGLTKAGGEGGGQALVTNTIRIFTNSVNCRHSKVVLAVSIS